MFGAWTTVETISRKRADVVIEIYLERFDHVYIQETRQSIQSYLRRCVLRRCEEAAARNHGVNGTAGRNVKREYNFETKLSNNLNKIDETIERGLQTDRLLVIAQGVSW